MDERLREAVGNQPIAIWAFREKADAVRAIPSGAAESGAITKQINDIGMDTANSVICSNRSIVLMLYS